MDTARIYELLKQEIKNKSIGKVAIELKLSKATVSLVARKKYPNPQKNISKNQREISTNRNNRCAMHNK